MPPGVIAVIVLMVLFVVGMFGYNKYQDSQSGKISVYRGGKRRRVRYLK